MEPEYITTEQAAQILDRAYITILGYAREGKLTRYRRTDGRVFYDKAEVEAFKAGRDTIVKAG